MRADLRRGRFYDRIYRIDAMLLRPSVGRVSRSGDRDTATGAIRWVAARRLISAARRGRPLSALLKRGRRGYPDGQTQGSAPQPERYGAGFAVVHSGTLRHRGWPGTSTLRNRVGLCPYNPDGPPRRLIYAARGLSRIQPGYAARRADPVSALLKRSHGAIRWADTGVCPHSGTLRHRVAPVHPRYATA